MAWCTECNKEYGDGLEICPICGDLLEVSKGTQGCDGSCASCSLGCDSSVQDDECDGSCETGLWPTDDKGEPVPPALLTTVMGNQLDYQMTLSLLHSFGIPTLESFTSTGTLAKVILGFAGTGMDIFVPETMVELARELLKPVEGEV
jgi:hypothetical protein